MVSTKKTIDTDLLSTFVAVARKGGVSAAALALHLSKSAVSKQLGSLEQRLQVRLFERTSRRVVLTPEGEGLLVRAESVLGELEQIVEQAHESKAVVRGTLRLAASPEFGAVMAEHFLPLLLKRHAGLQVSMSSDYGIEDLHDPSVDLAFRLGTVADDRLVVKQVGQFARVLVASPEAAHAALVDSPEDLEKQRCITFADKDGYAQWTLRELANPSIERQVRVPGLLILHSFAAMQGACIAGLGIAQMPAFVVADALQQGRLQAVLPGWRPTPVPVHVAYRHSMYRVARVRAAIDAALEWLPRVLSRLNETEADIR